MMKKVLTIAIVTALMVVTSTQAATAIFNGGAGSGDPSWFTVGNWDIGVPTTADEAWLDTSVGYGPTIDSAGAVAASMIVGIYGHDGDLTVDSAGTLAISTHIIIADNVGDNGTILNNGQITVGSPIYMRDGTADIVNNGTLTSTGLILGDAANSANGNAPTSTVVNTGTMNINGWLYLSNNGSNSVFNMNGGTLNTSNLEMPEGGVGRLNLNGGIITNAALGLNGNGGYTIEVDNGKMYSAGDHTGGLDFMINAGLITGKGLKTAYSTYDGTYTELGSIPEPAIIGALSLLGLALLRRK